MNKENFIERVYAITKQIPYGKVTTYGAIAEACGLRMSARMVGWALNKAIGDSSIPAHRVVNRNGELTGKIHFPTPDYMYERLESEGITFINEAVDLSKHLWLPEVPI